MMTRIPTRLTALLTAALFTTALAWAQETPENYVPYPHAFIGLQGGGQLTLSNHGAFRYVTPTASASVGVHFTPILGARIHVNGIWNKSGVRIDDTDVKYKYKYVTSDLDLMINMTNLLVKGNYHPLNVYLIGGIGINYAWDNQEKPELMRYISARNARNRLSHNFRVGVQCDYKVARNWSVNLELDANSLSDRFNSKTWSGSDDWQFTAQLGVTYRFGLPHKVKGNLGSSIIVDPTTIGTGTETASADTQVDIAKPEPAPAPQPAPVAKKEDITRNIFFDIRQTTVTAKEQPKLAEVAKWLKEHPTAKVSVTGYADKGTGNAITNARFAKERAEAVTKQLIKKYGIEASRITTDSKGDTVQPFAENDKNRVTIVIGQE